jgi:hypothetical protein
MPTRTSVLLLALACGLLASSALGQLPGETPRLRLTDGLGSVSPQGPGPWNNSHSFEAPAGLVFQAELTYLAHALPNDAVPWGMFVSTQQTAFPTGIFPPPLFTQPPFLFVAPFPATVDVDGEASHTFVVPPGLYDGTLYVQAIVQDGSAPPGEAIRLSNGLRVDIVPPPFHVSFGFAREVPALTGSTFIDGVGSRDFDGETLNTFLPFGNGSPPGSDVDPDSGLPELIEFLPIVPNVADYPTNPLNRPVAKVSQAVGPTPNEIVVDDTSFFPSEGTLLIAFQQNEPWSNKGQGGTKPPKAEVAFYKGKTATSFLNVQRKRVGSSGSSSYAHLVGEFVVGEYTLATTAGALARDRVGLDASNPKLPHVVLPTKPEGGPGSELDLYRYRDTATDFEGFALYDRIAHSWRVIGDTLIDASGGDTAWDAMITVSPDAEWFVAIQRTSGGDDWDYSPDKLWLIRMDGLVWPATGTEAWEIPYELDPDPIPEPDLQDARSRRVMPQSIGIIGSGPHDWVVYVGLQHLFEQSPSGTGVTQSMAAPMAYEAEYVREELLVRDYIEIPVITPGSGKDVWTGDRPRISGEFAPIGAGLDLQRFDPMPLVTDDHSLMVVTGGFDEEREDVYVIRQVSIGTDGEAVRTIQNITGHGSGAVNGADDTVVRGFDVGGHGYGPKAAFSPSNSRVAFVVREGTLQQRDFLHIARTNGSSFAAVAPLWTDSSGDFEYPGPLVNDRQINGLYWLDEDRLVFLMGRGYYGDPFGVLLASHLPGCDVFLYNRVTDELVNLTNTGGGASDFDTLGTIWPAGSFRSSDGRYVFYLRDGEISQGNTVLPPGTNVLNILAVDSVTETVFDVSGDELGALAPLRNLELPELQGYAPVESMAALRMVEGTGTQEGSFWFVAHEAGLGSDADELFCFDGTAPFLGLQLTEFSAAGSHITNVVPDPFATRTAFSQTADADPFGNTQHPFVVDFTSFLVKRDLTPILTSNGEPFGRVMDGSFHWIPPGNGVVDALVFSVGPDSDPATGLARDTLPVYLSMANITDVLLEPDPLVIALINNIDIGSDFRFYVLSAGASAAP